MPANKKTSTRPDRSPAGEIYVWLSALGLTVGLVMVVFLLGLILWNGIIVFWPKEVAQIRLKEGSTTGIQNQLSLGGSIIKKQQKQSPTDNEDNAQMEWQIFTGNKDAYGFMYKYIDAEAIESVTYPEDIMVAERMEYGDAIFTPISLTLPDDQIIQTKEPHFSATLEGLLKEIEQRREAIYTLEKTKLGALNRKLKKLRPRQVRFAQQGLEASATEAKKEIQILEKEYQMVAAKAQALRRQQDEAKLTYRLLTGEERTVSLGSIVRVYEPNTLSTLDKVTHLIVEFYRFLSENPREANTEGGIFPAIFGTFIMTLLMSIVVMPFGVLAAIYLREYAGGGFWVRSIRIGINNLAGVPSIVFGVFGLGFFVYVFGGSIDSLFFSDKLPTPTFGTGGILWASLTLALMTVPVVIVATEEALASVPRGVRQASLACGASRWQTIQRVVLPASAPGILTGLILAMARGAGEVAPLMLVGVVKLAPALPFDAVPPFIHLERKFMHLGFHIYDLGFQSPDSEAAKPMVFATTLLLILLVIILNLGVVLIRNHLRSKYKYGTF